MKHLKKLLKIEQELILQVAKLPKNARVDICKTINKLGAEIENYRRDEVCDIEWPTLGYTIKGENFNIKV